MDSRSISDPSTKPLSWLGGGGLKYYLSGEAKQGGVKLFVKTYVTPSFAFCYFPMSSASHPVLGPKCLILPEAPAA